MNQSNIIMYTTEDGLTKIEVTFDEDTVWLSLDQMAELFQRDKSTISRHIKNIFTEGELRLEATVAKFATVQMEGNLQVTRDIDYYNLDVIISVGYRIKSFRGTHYLKMTRRDILTTKGRVTHKQAVDKAHAEYEKYRKKAG